MVSFAILRCEVGRNRLVLFGGQLDPVRLAPGAEALLRFIPTVPSDSPERA